jgi:peptide/nickel transport system permease protein
MSKGLLKRLLSHPGGALGLAFLLLVVGTALIHPLFYTRSPWAIVGRPFLPPFSEKFPLGTDMLGRDVLVGLVHGARFSLLIGFLATLVSVGIGVTIGAVAGYFRGWVDEILMRITEFFQIIPGLVLVMLLVAVLGPSLHSVIIGIGVITWPNIARIMRAEVLSLRTRQFVEAARTAGQRPLAILFVQILPNALSSVIVVGSVMVASAILIESGLSFLGLGDPSVMTWGYMIGAARPFLRDAWTLSALPGLLIVFTVLSINMVGDGLTSALDPRQARKGTRA